MFLFAITSSSDKYRAPSLLPIQWVWEDLSPGSKMATADYTILLISEVKNSRSYTSTPLINLHSTMIK
jgi:hypothetical protein